MNQIVLPFAFAALAIGLFFSYTQPAYEALQAFQEQESRVSDVLMDARQLSQTVDQLQRKRASILKDDWDRIYSILPDNIDVVGSIIHFDNLARRSGIQLRSFSFPQVGHDSSDAEGVSSAVFTLDCIGTYDQFKSFLRSLETSAQLADITSLRIDVAPDVKTEEGAVRTGPSAQVYTVSITTYWMP